MFKKLFKGKKSAPEVAQEMPSGSAVGINYYSSDASGCCPKCGGTLAPRPCGLMLASFAGESAVETDVCRFCDDCPTMVVKTSAVQKLAKQEKLKGALPAAVIVDEASGIQEFVSYDGHIVDPTDTENPAMVQILSRIMGAPGGGAEMSRNGMSDAEKARKRNKRKQASKARKKNRKKR